MSAGDTTVRTPNDEQKLAIEHFGGFLLEAGAGSGKTFVLVEHAIFLLNDFLTKHKSGESQEHELLSNLKSFMSKKVLMTFTKKAAGELSLRLHRRLVQQAQVDEDNRDYWLSCIDNLDYMSVTTIDGFCFKLLSQGIFKNVPMATDIIGTVELRAKIEKLFNEWVLFNKSNGSFDEIRELVLVEKKDLLQAMVDIFQSPELRILWKKIDVTNPPDVNEDIRKILELEGFLELATPFPIYSYVEVKKKPLKYVEYFEKLENFVKETDVCTFDGMKALVAFAKEQGRHPSVPKATADEKLLEYNELLKKFIKFSRENIENFENYEYDMQAKILPWCRVVKSLFDFIEKNYSRSSGLTFADLEFYVLDGLSDPSVQDQIYEKYDYIIVDEFQDTSEIQFEIIEKIVKENFKRIFCVGDMKQAIYGFRGGELGVFKKCLDLVPKLSMTNNYRSEQNIIEFNNLLFENLFPKGHGFQGQDQNSVPVEFQNYPGENRSGFLNKRNVFVEDIEGSKNLDQPKQEFIESQMIYEYIKESKELRKAEERKQICILYRKLTPTKYLLPLLINNEVGFTCQIKISLSTDPIVGMFETLMESILLKRDGVDIQNSFLKLASYFSLVGLSLEKLDDKIRTFHGDVVIVGIWSAFQKFLFTSSVSNSNYKNNLSLVESICSQANGDVEKIMRMLGVNSKENYSVEFQYGENVEEVVIMTAHASKGLEFDEVILGGAHTNGKRQGNKNKFGKFPWSFRWKSAGFSKKYFKTPNFIIEDLINIKKEFSESKRLFYVACTRAKEKLTWFDINYGGNPQKYSDNSWIVGVRSWENDATDSSLEVRKVINESQTTDEFELTLEDHELKRLNNPRPFFHQDKLGIHSRDEGSLAGFSAETSVTKLALLTQCPRKYYLKNILKLDDIWLNNSNEDDLTNYSIKEKKETSETTETADSLNLNAGKTIESIIERGIEVHDSLSRMILRNLTIPIDCKKEYLNQLNFIKDELTPLKDDFHFSSEVPVKFNLFGQMISGTPDLVLLPKNKDQVLQIWDFKTGRYNEDKLAPYWFQLMCYAKAFEHEIKDGRGIELIISFVDDQKNITKKLNLSDIDNELFMFWKKLGNLAEKNDQHCSHCPYGNLCHPNPDSIAQNESHVRIST
tara:strand:- start:175083 stop:178502 length:3420 start_codon:yes stop_codon:yes gene_type:complete